MNKLTYLIAAALLIPGSSVYSQVPRDNSNRPCYDVNIQIDRNNRSNVRQDCGRNDSRTMQAGQTNDAMTSQHGDVNTNEVKQYGFDAQRRR